MNSRNYESRYNHKSHYCNNDDEGMEPSIQKSRNYCYDKSHYNDEFNAD